MNKIQKIFKASALLLQKPYLLNKIIDDNDVWRKKLEKEFSKDALQEIKLQDLMDGSAVTVNPFSFMEGGSLPTDLALLRMLAMKFDKCKYFEIPNEQIGNTLRSKVRHVRLLGPAPRN